MQKQEHLAVLMDEQPVLLKLVQQMVDLVKQAKARDGVAVEQMLAPQAGTWNCFCATFPLGTS